MRLLITGSTGFIGRYLVDKALELGFEVYAAVRQQSKRSVISDRPVHFLEVDYTDTAQMAGAFASVPHKAGTAPFDYVIHTAGLTKTTRPKQFMSVNAEQTRRLIVALEAQEAPPLRFVLMSSMGSYGANPSDKPMTSDMSQCPNTEYGRSKLCAEKYLKNSSLTYTILCPTGVYGAGEEDYFLSITSMMKGFSFVSGRTAQWLSFVYVRDVVKAVFFVIDREETKGQTYLISDGKSYTDSDFTAIVAAIIGRRVHEVRVPIPIIKVACSLAQSYGRITHHPYALNRDKYPILKHRNWLCDISPLLALGFTPEYDLESGLRETYKLTNGFRLWH